MKVTVVLMMSASVVFSLAQSNSIPSPECMRAVSNITMNCRNAYHSLLSGNTSPEDQAMTVCDTTGTCNGMLESIINACNDSQSVQSTNMMENIPTRSDLDLLCAIGPNGTNCYSIYINNDVMNNTIIGAAFMAVADECQQTCNNECRQNLTLLNNTLGCCLAEILQVQVRNGEMASSSNLNPELCGLPPFQFCNGSALPSFTMNTSVNMTNISAACVLARNNLFDPNDACSRAVQELSSNSGSAIIDLFIDNCPTRFIEYVNDCNDDNYELLQLVNTVISFTQAENSNGTRCVTFLKDFMSREGGNDEINCITDYLMGLCSDTCKQTLMNMTAKYECCFNTIITELIGRSDDFNRQIEYAILTRDIYALCDVPSAGFCSGINPLPYSDEANRCTMAVDSFYGDDTCLDNYRTLSQRSSTPELNDAATEICTNQMCRNRMRSYTDYLIACQVGNNEDGDDNNGNNSDMEEEDTGYLELAYITGNTTCRVNSSDDSCYYSIYSDDNYGLVFQAINNGVCASMMGQQPGCTSNCTELLSEIMNNTGCCLGEYSRALLGDAVIESISSTCNVPLNIRCTEMKPAQGGSDGTDGDGANTQKGLGVLTILILVTITIQLF